MPMEASPWWGVFLLKLISLAKRETSLLPCFPYWTALGSSKLSYFKLSFLPVWTLWTGFLQHQHQGGRSPASATGKGMVTTSTRGKQLPHSSAAVWSSIIRVYLCSPLIQCMVRLSTQNSSSFFLSQPMSNNTDERNWLALDRDVYFCLVKSELHAHTLLQEIKASNLNQCLF